MSDDDHTTSSDDRQAAAAAPTHLRAVTAPQPADITAAGRPRTIGRLIAQTALIADSAVTRHKLAVDDPADPRGPRGPRGRFRLR